MSDENFQKNIRLYNNALCLATFGVDGKQEDGWSTFKFQGRCYHRLGKMKAAEGETKKFGQFFIHDPDMSPDQEAQGRIEGQTESMRCRLNKETVKKLQEMLKETNRLVQQFRYVAELPEFELANKKFVLRSDIRSGH